MNSSLIFKHIVSSCCVCVPLRLYSRAWKREQYIVCISMTSRLPMFSRAKGILYWKTNAILYSVVSERGGNLFFHGLSNQMEGVFMRGTVWVLYITFLKTWCCISVHPFGIKLGWWMCLWTYKQWSFYVMLNWAGDPFNWIWAGQLPDLNRRRSRNRTKLKTTEETSHNKQYWPNPAEILGIKWENWTKCQHPDPVKGL